MIEPLGIVAGQGQLPLLLMEACRAQQRPFFVLAFQGQTPSSLIADDVDHLWLSLGELGRGLDALKQRKISKLVLAGGMQRPSLSGLKVDWRGARFLARVGMRALGDDTLLQLILEELSKEGLEILGAHEILTSLQRPEGPLGQHSPSPEALVDIQQGIHVLKTLSPLDIGQAVVVQQGVVLGVEAVEGTDALLLRCASLQKSGLKATLVKLAKSQQDTRVDLPTLGLRTLELIIQGKMGGIVFEANKALLLDAEAMQTTADAHGIFLVGVAAS